MLHISKHFIHFSVDTGGPQKRVQFYFPLQDVAHTAAHQAFDVGDRTNIMQLFSPIDKRGQPRCVQWHFGVLSTLGAPTPHPGVLKTGSSTGSLPGILLKH